MMKLGNLVGLFLFVASGCAVAQPVANADAVETQVGTYVIISVLDNDVASSGRMLTGVDIASAPSNGYAGVMRDLTVVYVPDVGYSGDDQFAYRVVDDQGLAAQTTASITVNPSDDPFLDCQVKQECPAVGGNWDLQGRVTLPAYSCELRIVC